MMLRLLAALLYFLASTSAQAGFVINSFIEFPASSGITYVGSATANATSVTLPAHVSGDTILIWAYRSNSATSPSTAAGYTLLLNPGNGNNSAALGYKVAASSSETSGTWTNATKTSVVIYRGVSSYGFGIGEAGSASPISHSTFTLQVTDGTSWLAAFSSAKTGSPGVPSGLTARLAAKEADTNGGVATWANHSTAFASGTDVWASAVVELKK